MVETGAKRKGKKAGMPGVSAVNQAGGPAPAVCARGPDKLKRFEALGYTAEELHAWDQRLTKQPPPYRFGFAAQRRGLDIGDPLFDELPLNMLACHGKRAGQVPQDPEPEWVDWARIRRGQELWLYHLSRAFAGLGLSLLSGFSITRFAEVLYRNGYAVNGETAMRRYSATAYAILDFFSHDLSDPASRARQSLYTVRAMHAFARRKSKDLFDKENGEGVPLSQMDMAEVQLGFSGICLTFIENETGYGPIHREEARDMVFLWRYLGWHLGIMDEYNCCTSLDTLDACTADYMAWTPRRMETVTFATQELRRTAIEGFAMQTGLGENFWHAAFDLVLRNPRVDLRHLEQPEKKYYKGIDFVAKYTLKALAVDAISDISRKLLIAHRENKLDDPKRAEWKEAVLRRMATLHDKVIWRLVSFLFVFRHVFAFWAAWKMMRYGQNVSKRLHLR